MTMYGQPVEASASLYTPQNITQLRPASKLPITADGSAVLATSQKQKKGAARVSVSKSKMAIIRAYQMPLIRPLTNQLIGNKNKKAVKIHATGGQKSK